MAEQINGFFPGELLPTTTVGGCIDIFEGAWPNPKETIEAMDFACSSLDSGARWVRAKTVGNRGSEKRTNNFLSVTEEAMRDSAIFQNIHNQMNMLLLATTIPYAKKHDIEALYHEGYQALKYSGGQEYKAHADGTTAMGRAVSAIVYLNDNYSGGEVEFVNFGLKIKPKPGMLLLFPSTYPYTHIAHPVTEGLKYALVTWIHDRPLD